MGLDPPHMLYGIRMLVLKYLNVWLQIRALLGKRPFRFLSSLGYDHQISGFFWLVGAAVQSSKMPDIPETGLGQGVIEVSG